MPVSSNTDLKLVHDARDTARRERRADGRLALGHRVHMTPQGDHAALDFDGEMPGLPHGLPRQGGSDLRADILAARARLDGDAVVQTAHTRQCPDALLGTGKLVAPVDLAGQCDPAVLDLDLHLAIGNQGIQAQSRGGLLRDLGITALVLCGERDVKLQGDAAHASNAVNRLLHRVLLGEAVEVAGEGDHALLDDDADTQGIDGRVPGEFIDDIGPELTIGFHRGTPLKQQPPTARGGLNIFRLQPDDLIFRKSPRFAARWRRTFVLAQADDPLAAQNCWQLWMHGVLNAAFAPLRVFRVLLTFRKPKVLQRRDDVSVRRFAAKGGFNDYFRYPTRYARTGPDGSTSQALAGAAVPWHFARVGGACLRRLAHPFIGFTFQTGRHGR